MPETGASRALTRPPLPIRTLNRAGRVLSRLGIERRLDAGAMLRAAAKQGLPVERLPPLAREGLEVRVKAFNEDADLTLFGQIAIDQQLRRCLANALRMERAIERHPEILDEEIRRPLVVVGMPRTGTTLMQRLLSLHQGARCLRFWEGYAPVPRDLEHPAADRDNRRREATRALAQLYWVAPSLRAVHPMATDDPEECFHLMRNYFVVPRWFDFANIKSYWEWIDGRDATEAYKLMKRQLQVLQWLEPREHWVLKCPMHMGYIEELLRVFPDARIVYTHREETEVAASIASLMTIMWRMTSDAAHPHKVGRWSLETTAALHAKGRPAMARLGPDRLAEVEFGSLMRDHAGTAARIYEQLGYRPDPTLSASIKAWSSENPREKHGRHIYALPDFGLTKADVERAFG